MKNYRLLAMPFAFHMLIRATQNNNARLWNGLH